MASPTDRMTLPPDTAALVERKPWLELRPRENGDFDEIVARFADGLVHVETMSGKGVYIGFYHDDGRAQQLWISSDKKLRYTCESANGPPPRFTAQGVDRGPPA